MGRILIIADKGETRIATSRGLKLAAKLGHSAEVVAFVYEALDNHARDKAHKAQLQQQILERRREQVQARIDKFARSGQQVALKVVWLKDIHPWITKRATSVNFDLIVKTGHESKRFGYTTTDWHLLRECPAPVLITAENKWSRTRPVLAAIDLDTKKRTKQVLNSKILSTAKALAENLGVELKVVSAIQVPTILADLDIVDPGTYAKERRAAMLPKLKALAKEQDISEKDFILKRGPVDKVINSQAAKIRAQIVVMGTVARQGIRARMVGNTAESVLQHLRTDVLALKPDS